MLESTKEADKHNSFQVSGDKKRADEKERGAGRKRI